MAAGSVRYAFLQPANFLSEASVRAAVAAECAASQGKFLEYHDAVFERSQTEGESLFTREGLVSLAKDLDLQTDEFTNCLLGGQGWNALQPDRSAAAGAGVRATPTIFINDVMYEALRSFEFYEQEIEAALEK